MIWPFTRKKEITQRPKSKTYTRAYAAAAVNRLTADWNAPESTADMELFQYLRTLRNRARDLERNNDYIRRYFELLIENVVGHKGIGVQFKAADFDGKVDKWANDYIEDKWRQWGGFGCTVCGSMTWLDVQRIALRSMARDGEVLIVMHKNWAGNESGFAIQVLESDYLDIDYSANLEGGGVIRMGVEKDRYGKPVAYHIHSQHPADISRHGFRKERIRYPAEQVIHLRRPERPGETRSAPWITSVAHRLRQIAAAEEAEVVAWRIAASKMGFYLPGDDSQYDGDDEDADGNPISEAEPGIFETLKRGWDFKEWNPDKPVSTVESFLKAELRGVASGLNVSYVSLANNLEGVSFSSIRSGELADRSAWRTVQTLLIQHLCQPVCENWLLAAMTNGFVNLPMGKFAKFNKQVWRPRGWEWVNPAQEATAAQNDVANCFKSLYDIAAERGVEFEEVLEANRQAKEMAEKAGMIIPAFIQKETGNERPTEETE